MTFEPNRTIARGRLAGLVPFAIAGAAFAADLILPHGLAVRLLYLPAVISCLWLRHAPMPLWIATISSGLVVAGHFLSPPITLPIAIAITNRTLTIVVLWICAGFVVQSIRKAAAIRNSTALLNAIGTYAPAAIYVRDLDARLIYANPAAEDLLRDNAAMPKGDTAIGKTALEILGDHASADRLIQSDRRVLSTGQSETVEEVVSACNGQRYLTWTKAPLRDDNGLTFGVVGVAHDITEHKQATVALSESKRALQGHSARQALLLQVSGSLIARGDDEYAIIRTVFDHLRDPLQLDFCFNYRLEADGRSLRLVAGIDIPPEFDAAAQSIAVGEGFCGAVAQLQTPVVADAACIATDSRGKFVRQIGAQSYICHPLHAGGGELLGTLAFASRRRSEFSSEEVTFIQTVCHFVALAWERLDNERALRVNEEQLQLAMNIGQIGYWSWNATRDRIEWSDQLRRMNGYGPEEFGASFEGLLTKVHPEDRGYLRRMIEQAATSGDDFDCELRFVRGDGRIRWARAKGRVALDAHGRLTGMNGIELDITQQRAAEAERGHLAAIVDSSTDAIVSKNLDGIVTTWNTSAEQLFGYSAAEMIGRSIAVIIPNDRLAEEQFIRSKIRDGETIQHYETVRVRKDGTCVPVWLSISPVKNAQGAIIGGSIIARDITERKQAEQSLRDFTQQLETADKRKDEFLAMLAHELRNPLTPILNASVLLSRKLGQQPELRSHLAMLDRQAHQLTRLVDDLLDISRISRGRITLEHRPLEFGEVVAQAIESVEPLMFEKRHRFIVIKAESQLYVRGDRTRLVQSVGNLLHNAVKYTDTGGNITLAVLESSTHITLEVHDSGAGISPELMPHVFDLFVQSERTLDRSQGGLGIGLSVVKSLIGLHGGSVEARSAGLGQGATFTIHLPRIAAPAAVIEDSGSTHMKARRIIVVDDNVDVADSLAMVLKLDGHDVRTVYSAHAAIEAAEQLTPEVMILDIGLPDMDGYEVARRLRAKTTMPYIRLVAVTGYGQAEDRDRAVAAGFDHHLVKPANLAALQELLTL